MIKFFSTKIIRTKIVLALIIVLGLVLRVYQLGELPSILNRDEAALAYNALLLKQTGTDEWGRSWPLTLESFGDYKLPGYPFTLVGFFQVLPSDDFTTRLPSVLAGTVLIFLAYLLARSIKLSSTDALLASLLVAITPVFFFYSRVAFEANLGLTLFVSMLVLLLAKVKGNKRMVFDFLAVFMGLMSVFTYNTPLLILPFVIIALPILRDFKKIKTWITPTLGLLLVVLIAFLQFSALTSQKSSVTIFGDETVWTESVTYRESFSGVAQRLIGNKFVFYGKTILPKYLESFTPNFLVNGLDGHPWHSLPDNGHIYWIVYLLGLVGILVTLNKTIKRKISREELFLVLLLLVSPLPSAVTVDAPHATRSLLFFFILIFFSVRGLDSVKKVIAIKKRKTAKLFLMVSFFTILSFETYSYMSTYFNKYPSQQGSFLPGFDQIIEEVELNYPDKQVAVVDEEGFYYILLAWYLKMPATNFFGTIVRQQPDRIGFKYGERLGNYHLIVHRDDRVSEESVLVEWQGDRWRIIDFSR